MPKQTKNILTYEKCKNELIRWAKGAMVSNLVLLVIMLLTFVPLFAMCIYVAKEIHIFCIVFAPLCAIAPTVFACRVIGDGLTLRKINRGGFSIVKDTVCRLSKGEIPRKHSEGQSSADVIYFTKYGRFVATGINFDLASVDDIFYLVILNAKKEKLVMAYHSKMYELKDVNVI